MTKLPNDSLLASTNQRAFRVNRALYYFSRQKFIFAQIRRFYLSFFSENSKMSLKKRDYDADLDRLKTFIDSYHNNDPDRNGFNDFLLQFTVETPNKGQYT